VPSIRGTAAAVIAQAELERLVADAAESVARVRATGLEVRGIAIRSGNLHGIESVVGVPVVRLHPDSLIGFGVIV
jgi:hypothetical protein